MGLTLPAGSSPVISLRATNAVRLRLPVHPDASLCALEQERLQLRTEQPGQVYLASCSLQTSHICIHLEQTRRCISILFQWPLAPKFQRRRGENTVRIDQPPPFS